MDADTNMKKNPIRARVLQCLADIRFQVKGFQAGKAGWKKDNEPEELEPVDEEERKLARHVGDLETLLRKRAVVTEAEEQPSKKMKAQDGGETSGSKPEESGSSSSNPGASSGASKAAGPSDLAAPKEYNLNLPDDIVACMLHDFPAGEVKMNDNLFKEICEYHVQWMKAHKPPMKSLAMFFRDSWLEHTDMKHKKGRADWLQAAQKYRDSHFYKP
jgi:hypothetical protein